MILASKYPHHCDSAALVDSGNKAPLLSVSERQAHKVSSILAMANPGKRVYEPVAVVVAVIVHLDL
jgi:hypothetical protein